LLTPPKASLGRSHHAGSETATFQTARGEI